MEGHVPSTMPIQTQAEQAQITIILRVRDSCKKNNGDLLFSNCGPFGDIPVPHRLTFN